MSRSVIAPAAAAAPEGLTPPSPSGKTIGIVAGIVAGLAVLGFGGYFGYRMLFPSEVSSRVATSDVPPSTTPAVAPALEPPKDVMPAPQPPPQDAVSMQSSGATKPDSGAKSAAKDGSAATDMTAPGASKAPGAAAKTDPSKAAPTKGATPGGPPGSSPSTPETPGVVAQGRPPSQPGAAADRWQQMREAMARCAGDNFFKRVACEQGVGQQYCEGFWGRVPQCPSGPPREKGQ